MRANTEVFIDPLTDFGFKRLFGEEESKPLLISFLNDILPIDSPIATVAYQNLEKMGATPADRKAVYDIYCVDEQGKSFIVELQRALQFHFVERAIYYTTFPIQEQASKGKWDFELSPVYFVGILNFEVGVFKNDNYIHYCTLKDETNHTISNALNFIYIELPKFKKAYEELSKHLEYWLYFFKASAELKEIPEKFKEDILSKAFERSQFLRLSSKDQNAYYMELKHLRDYYNTIDYAQATGKEEGREEGREEGKKEGREEGEKKAKIEIANKMLSKGFDINTVSEFLEVNIDTLKTLISNLHTR